MIVILPNVLTTRLLNIVSVMETCAGWDGEARTRLLQSPNFLTKFLATTYA